MEPSESEVQECAAQWWAGCVFCGAKFNFQSTPGRIKKGYVCRACCTEQSIPYGSVIIGRLFPYDRSRPEYNAG